VRQSTVQPDTVNLRQRGWSLTGFRESRSRWGDASLTALLVTQSLTIFVAIPIAATHPAGRALLDVSHLVVAAVSALALTDRLTARSALLASLLVVAVGPAVWDGVGARLDFGANAPHEMIAMVAFIFTVLVTALVMSRTFAPGRVTAHRVQGAVLVYLNVAALCTIAFDVLATHSPGAIMSTVGGLLPTIPGARMAELSYFSLTTITTTGYGDLVPVHPLARSLANLEALFGQLFPATFLARLVALHLAHGEARKDASPDNGSHERRAERHDRLGEPRHRAHR
jgi:hypothetical protein